MKGSGIAIIYLRLQNEFDIAILPKVIPTILLVIPCMNPRLTYFGMMKLIFHESKLGMHL